MVLDSGRLSELLLYEFVFMFFGAGQIFIILIKFCYNVHPFFKKKHQL